ncbi:hypothetical protein [Rhodovibrio salinarum]|uniref:Lipoprotein n=1 Tax=Rhodovibrio salinarum TaxID=1087 RepID=A0A934QMK2_9PROT|nr:hypothetical protein [Rhodovibrio salinarum]MBK1699069.1 hypothetical protein [Rhodovibrio salinarum]
MKTTLLALLLLSLTACQAFPPMQRSDEAGNDSSAAGLDDTSSVRSDQDDPAEEDAAARERRWASLPKPSRPPQRGELSEERLTGLTTDQTWQLLGPPSQVEEESPATVWTYAIAGCRLELFFYFDLESQEQRTLALDLEAGSEFVGSRPFCWYTLAKRGRSRAAPLPQADTSGGGRKSARVPTAEELDQQAGTNGGPDFSENAAPDHTDDAAAQEGARLEGENAQ